MNYKRRLLLRGILAVSVLVGVLLAELYINDVQIDLTPRIELGAYTVGFSGFGDDYIKDGDVNYIMRPDGCYPVRFRKWLLFYSREELGTSWRPSGPADMGPTWIEATRQQKIERLNKQQGR